MYWNITKGIWSVRAAEGPLKGKVVAHAREVLVQGPEFVVGEAGRLRVLRERRKNVHAFVRGEVRGDLNLNAPRHEQLVLCPVPRSVVGTMLTHGRGVTYNPYKNTTFVTRAPATQVHTAKGAFMTILSSGRARVDAVGLK